MSRHLTTILLLMSKPHAVLRFCAPSISIILTKIPLSHDIIKRYLSKLWVGRYADCSNDIIVLNLFFRWLWCDDIGVIFCWKVLNSTLSLHLFYVNCKCPLQCSRRIFFHFHFSKILVQVSLEGSVNRVNSQQLK